MNHSNFSPGQPNEAVGRKVTPSSHNSMMEEDGGDTSGSTTDPGSKKQSVGARFLLSEDLQKIKHSSHRNAARRESSSDDDGDEEMDDSDHDHVIKDLLYPALEDSSSRNMNFDFFEEDYNAAQAAMNSSVTSTAPSVAATSFRSSTTSMPNDSSFRNSSITSNTSSRGLVNDSSFTTRNDSTTATSTTTDQSYLNYLRRRGATSDDFDQTTQKHRR